MRELAQDEKRKALKCGDKYEFPKIFKLNGIKVKWENEEHIKPEENFTRVVSFDCLKSRILPSDTDFFEIKCVHQTLYN